MSIKLPTFSISNSRVNFVNVHNRLFGIDLSEADATFVVVPVLCSKHSLIGSQVLLQPDILQIPMLAASSINIKQSIDRLVANERATLNFHAPTRACDDLEFRALPHHLLTEKLVNY